jgi:hypothetical protein
MSRLLVLEDRMKDAESLCNLPPIQDNFPGVKKFLKSVDQIPQDTEFDNYSIIVAQTLTVAMELLKRHRFEFVITDLMLFDPDRVDGIAEVDYFPSLKKGEPNGFPTLRAQIIHPSGLSFLKILRNTNRPNGTPQFVPAIAMTFFWQHPRFDKFYVEQIKKIDGEPIGYLPKYYWEDSEIVRQKGNDTLGALISLLQGRDKTGIRRKLIPLLCDAVVLDLIIEENRRNVRKTLDEITNSFHTACRTVVDFILVFKLGGVLESDYDAKPDSFYEIVSAVKEAIQNARHRGVTVGISVAARFPKARDKEARQDRRHDKEILSFRRREGAAAQKAGDLQNISEAASNANLQKFAVCLALAMYTYPLANSPHCLTYEDLVQLLRLVGLPTTEDALRLDMLEIRKRLQSALPDDIRDFVSAKKDLLVGDGHNGIYLNGTYEIVP